MSKRRRLQVCFQLFRVFATLFVGSGLAYSQGAWAFATTFVDPKYAASSFATLNVNTNSIALDAGLDLYVRDSSSGGQSFTILRLTAASGYTSSSVFATMSRDPNTSITGLAFDQSGTLFASLTDSTGDAGSIRNVATGAVVTTLPNFRPTGIEAAVGNVLYFSGRLLSDGTFGAIYSLSPTNGLQIAIPAIVATGVALDAAGNIFVSTKGQNFGSYLANSIYRFDAAEGFATPHLVATFDSSVGELAFDSAGRLYAMENNADNLATNPTEIIRLTEVSAPPTPTPTTPDPHQDVAPPPTTQAEYSVPSGQLPVAAVSTTATGQLGSATLTVTLDLSKVLSGGSLAGQGQFAALYNIYVLALLPSGALGLPSSTWGTLSKTLGWSVLGSPVVAYIEGLAQDATNSVEISILQNLDVTGLVGTEFYIGYGTDEYEMLNHGRYRGVYKVQ